MSYELLKNMQMLLLCVAGLGSRFTCTNHVTLHDDGTNMCNMQKESIDPYV